MFNHFERVSDALIKKTKCVVIIRHPYEIIMSGVRYHETTSAVAEQKWLDSKRSDLNGLSYRQHLQNLSMDEKITFEMENKARRTINCIYNDIKNRNFNSNVLLIKLEDLYDKQNIPGICKNIEAHCKPSVSTQCNRLIKCFWKTLAIPFQRTNKDNCYTFRKNFKKHHIRRFNELFPSDTLDVLGYVGDSKNS